MTNDQSPFAVAMAARGDGAQADLARELGISPAQVWRWVHKDVKPIRLYRAPVAKWLDLPEEELWP